jgi:hypothetical protein
VTRLTRNVKREVAGTLHGERLVIMLTGDGVTIREKGRRTTYGPLPYGWLYLQGAKQRADETMKQRKLNKKRRRAR